MSSSSGAAGCTCTWGPDATSRRGGSQLGPWPRLTPSRGQPFGGCEPLSASSRSCGSSTTTVRTRTTTRSRETTHPRLTGRSARRRRTAAARPAGAGSDRTAAAGRWPSSPGARPRCAPRDTRGEQPAAAALDRTVPLLPGMAGVKRPSRVSGWPLLRPPLGAMMARRSPVCFGSSPDKALCEAVKRQDRCDRSSPNQVVSSGEMTLLPATSGRCRTRPGVEWDSRYLAATYGLNRAHANV